MQFYLFPTEMCFRSAGKSAAALSLVLTLNQCGQEPTLMFHLFPQAFFGLTGGILPTVNASNCWGLLMTCQFHNWRNIISLHCFRKRGSHTDIKRRTQTDKHVQVPLPLCHHSSQMPSFKVLMGGYGPSLMTSH